MGVEIGQVVWLKLRFNNEGDVSATEHPYLILKFIDDNTIEVGQLDKVRGKRWKLALESNKLITHDNPNETVIMEDSFIQMDNQFQLELYDGLKNYQKTSDKLSHDKMQDVIKTYEMYHQTHEIDENKQVYLSSDEIKELNKA